MLEFVFIFSGDRDRRLMLRNQWSCCIQMEPAGVPFPTFLRRDTTPRRLGWSHVLVARPRHVNHVWHSLAEVGRKVTLWLDLRGTLKLGGPHPKVCSSWVVLVVGGRPRSCWWKMDTQNLASDWTINHSEISTMRLGFLLAADSSSICPNVVVVCCLMSLS